MSIRQTFPDVVVTDDGILRLITRDAMSWVHMHRGATGYFYDAGAEDAPRVVTLPMWCAKQMEEDGLVVRRNRTGKESKECCNG